MPGVEIIQLVVMFILIQHKAVPLQNVLCCTLLSHFRVCASTTSHMALYSESEESLTKIQITFMCVGWREECRTGAVRRQLKGMNV